jgi:16S rRNA (guanine966-N2)-methyltransferase
MSIKILGGLAKNQSLLVPKGDLIRPTSVLLKRRLFDAFQNWEEGVFVDLCAGSGSMGLEAWSRGADQVILIEGSHRVFPVLKKNVEKIKERFPEEVRQRPIIIIRENVEKWIKEQVRSGGFKAYHDQELILFLDPPYEKHQIYKNVSKMVHQLPGFSGQLWIESDEQKGIESSYWEANWDMSKFITQGVSYLALCTPKKS